MQRCLISLLSFCGLCFSPQFLVAEIDATKGDFSLDEAKVILQIRAAENPHGIDKMSPKEKVRDDVRLLSASNKMAFVSEIALGAIQRIDGGISGVSADRVSVSLLASTVDRDTKLETLKRIHDHGARKYYATWLSFFDRNSSLATNDMLQNRQALIWKSYVSGHRKMHHIGHQKMHHPKAV